MVAQRLTTHALLDEMPKPICNVHTGLTGKSYIYILVSILNL